MSQREHYWVSFFAMTIAQALTSKSPKIILRPALQRFMRESGANEVRAQIYAVLQEVKTNGSRG